MAAIDAHLHLLPTSRLFGEWAAKTGATLTPEGLRREMDAHEVERAVVLGHFDARDGAVEGPFANRSNNELLHVVGESSDRLRGLFTVNVQGDGAADLDAIEAHLGPSFPGVKFFVGYEPYSPTDPRLAPVYEMLERKRVIAMFHTGDTLLASADLKYAHPLPVDEIATRHPDLRIVLAHAGQHWMHDAGELVGKNPNVYADLSGWFLGRELPWFADFVMQQFRELIFWADSCDKLMFGSDWPLMRIGPYLEFMDRCDFLSKGEKRKILYENAKRLYWGGD